MCVGGRGGGARAPPLRLTARGPRSKTAVRQGGCVHSFMLDAVKHLQNILQEAEFPFPLLG